jgi:beta-lactamase class D
LAKRFAWAKLAPDPLEPAMTPRSSFSAALMLAAALALPACSKVEQAVKSVGGRAPGSFDKGRLDAAIDRSMGGPNTCVVLADTKSGGEAYRYGDHGACMRELPPCSTFDIPIALVALETGAAAPGAVVKWDRTPQAAKALEKDADLKTAFKAAMPWFFRKVAREQAPALAKAIGDFDYGNRSHEGPADSFWMGPQQGGRLGVSTRGQAAFLRRLYTDRLPVKAGSAAFIRDAMVDEIRSGSTVSGRTGTCPSNADGSRQVGWWIGRLQGPKGDYVFAASIEGEGALPGLEVQTRMKSAFAQAALWPDMPEG